MSWSVMLALAMVALRVLLFDGWTFFRLEYVPSHDMYQAAAFFATSMHSMRLTSDIVWWNPAFDNGYAQYYQAFLSPLAPTPSHVVFIAWAQTVRLLARAGIRIPEYFQYLTITYLVFPFLATLAFAWMCGLIFRSRSAVALAVTVFTLSGIGLWNSGWFYFQESFTLFLLLGGILAFLKQPTVRSFALALAAVLVQIASLNYWSVYDSWFVIIFLGAYALVHGNQVRRAGRRLRQMGSLWPLPAAGIAILAGVVTVLWLALLLSAVRDQSAQYLRWGQERLPRSEAAENVRPSSYYTTHLFQPDLFALVEAPYDTARTMHHAGYVGAFLVPLLLVWLFFPPRGQQWWWLFLAAAGVTVVCVGPALLIRAWEIVPFMDRIRHLFRFYPAFLRVLLVLMAAAGLDRILSRETPAPPFKLAVLAAGTALSLILIRPAFGGLARFGMAWVPAAAIIVVPAVCVGAILARPGMKTRRLGVAVLLLVALADLSTYFRLVSRLDADFTATRWTRVPRPLPAAVTGPLRRSWEPLDPTNRRAVFENMPVSNDFWPKNQYMPHRYVSGLGQAAPDPALALWDPLLAFHAAGATPEQSQAGASPRESTFLLREAVPLGPAAAHWGEWGYNRWSVEVEVPRDGWLSIAQVHDPNWKARMDGDPVAPVRANYVRTAVPIPRGRHRVEMDYRPLSRRLYPAATGALALALAVLALVYVKTGQAATHSI